MLTSYVVVRNMRSNGWDYGHTSIACQCIVDGTCPEVDSGACTGRIASGCQCSFSGYCGERTGRSSCAIEPWRYAGNIFIYESSDPAVAAMLQTGILARDSSIPSADELLKDERYQTLTTSRPRPDQILFPTQ